MVRRMSEKRANRGGGNRRGPGGAGGGGAVGWFRRRLLVSLARGFALAGVLAIAQFAVGRVMTDRAHWSQYLFWIPVLWTLLGAWACWALSAAAGRLALRPGGVMVRPLLLVACVGLTAWIGFAEWRVHRGVAGVLGMRAAIERGRSLRLMHWNQAGRDEIVNSGAMIRELGADIAVVVNSRNGENRREIVMAMFETMAPPAEGTVRVLPAIEDQREPGHIYGDWRVIVGTKGTILRTGVVALPGVEGRDPAWSTGRDAGAVIWLEIDVSAVVEGFERPFVLWVVDLPSDPSLWRMGVMKSAAAAVAAWEQPAWETTPGGWWRAVGEPVGVPRPDVVMGDFNTVRGSASLAELTPGMRDAFEEAGWGRGNSWRQARTAGPGGPLTDRAVSKATRALLPLADWHIDLTLVGDAWRAGRYRLVDPGGGPHWVQVADLVLPE